MRSAKFFLIFTFVFLVEVSFASGYVDKESYLYPIMVDIRNKNYDVAMEKLEPYVAKNDSTALFWYGYMKQQNFGRDRYDAFIWFEKAADLGNPYAMYKLSGDADSSGVSEVCEINSWPCSEDRYEQAMDRWENLAKKGDIKSGFIYGVKNRSFVVRFYENESGKSLERMVTACRNDYCQPFVRTLRHFSKKNFESRGEGFLNAIIELENKDPAIATVRAAFFYQGLTNDQRIDMLVGSLKSGYYRAGIHLFELALRDNLIPLDDAYVYGRVAELGGFGDDRTGYLTRKKLLSEEKIPGLEIKAKKFFGEIDHVINFDEMDFMFMFKPDV